MFARNFLCVLVCGFLTACGFKPLYGPHSGFSGGHFPISISLIPDRDGQILRNHLLDRLTPRGEPIDPKYRLDIKLKDSKTPLTVRKDGTASRYKLSVVADIKLYDLTEEKVVYEDSAQSISSYTIGEVSAQAAYSTLVSEKDARERALEAVADSIKMLLAAYQRS